MMRLLYCSVIGLLVCSAWIPTSAAQNSGAENSGAENSGAENSGTPAGQSSGDAASAEASTARPAMTNAQTTPTGSNPNETEEETTPWDYDPYKVLVWIVSDNTSVRAATIEPSLRAYLDRDFAAVWRLEIADAPTSVRTAASRDIDSLTYDSMTASDPVLAVKRDHPDAVRIRIARNVGEYVKKIHATKDQIAEFKQKSLASGDDNPDVIQEKLAPVEGDAIAVQNLWSASETEALLISRGMATVLSDPEAKILTPEMGDLVAEAFKQYDKIFIVRIESRLLPAEVKAVEFDTLMRHLGTVAQTGASSLNNIPIAIGEALVKAFAPVVRIENAGQKSAVGLLRAGGLILENDRDSSPAFVRAGDVLEPMVRKNDRNGNPILIGPMDWAYLLVNELTGDNDRNVEMGFYAGRVGGLQGRKNKRTFRMALKVRPFQDSTTLRLHLKNDQDFPLIGYELYDKDLESGDMTLVGRTDWNGRMLVRRNDEPFRLLYVKNGGAVLARLPIVPGLYPQAVADLLGDDKRLQAEAYIRGVQNSIVDLVAVRELFKARIRLRLQRGEMEKAEELLVALKEQPSRKELSDTIGDRHVEFLKELQSGNANQRRKVDEMFSTTRELLAQHISPKLIRDLEADMSRASENGGKLPPESDDDSEETSSDQGVPAAAEEASKAKAST